MSIGSFIRGPQEQTCQSKIDAITKSQAESWNRDV